MDELIDDIRSTITMLPRTALRLRLEEALLLMSSKSSTSTTLIHATPRVLAPTLIQCIVLVFGFRASWMAYRRKHEREGKLLSISNMHAGEVPKWMADNPYIRHGFRPPRMSVTGCVCSCGAMHNETINIWTHFFASLYFVNAFFFCRRRLARWQALVAAYLFSASTIAHCFFPTGEVASWCLFGFDRASIAIYFYAVSVFITYAHFESDSVVQKVWLGASTCVGLMAAGVLGGLSNGLKPSISAGILMSQMAFGTLPVFRELWITPHSYIRRLLFKYLTLCTLSGTFGAIAYTNRFPEKFFCNHTWVLDYVGNSHNIMHVSVAMATFFAYRVAFLWELELQRLGKILGRV
eukprot:c13055_g2_i3.p1 GENE.c13055_g2_i3~~c13055_g2_i3.p1  ORF type:complete len:377 (-),score=57.72 c13055_g2_i3:175-1227(-)